MVTGKYFPTHELRYSDDMVCFACGSTEWHVNLFYSNRKGNWYYGEIGYMGEESGEGEVWCGDCDAESHLVDVQGIYRTGRKITNGNR